MIRCHHYGRERAPTLVKHILTRNGLLSLDDVLSTVGENTKIENDPNADRRLMPSLVRAFQPAVTASDACTKTITTRFIPGARIIVAMVLQTAIVRSGELMICFHPVYIRGKYLYVILHRAVQTGSELLATSPQICALPYRRFPGPAAPLSSILQKAVAWLRALNDNIDS